MRHPPSHDATTAHYFFAILLMRDLEIRPEGTNKRFNARVYSDFLEHYFFIILAISKNYDFLVITMAFLTCDI
jgi:hypothetical protein